MEPLRILNMWKIIKVNNLTNEVKTVHQETKKVLSFTIPDTHRSPELGETYIKSMTDKETSNIQVQEPVHSMILPKQHDIKFSKSMKLTTLVIVLQTIVILGLVFLR